MSAGDHSNYVPAPGLPAVTRVPRAQLEKGSQRVTGEGGGWPAGSRRRTLEGETQEPGGNAPLTVAPRQSRLYWLPSLKSEVSLKTTEAVRG